MGHLKRLCLCLLSLSLLLIHSAALGENKDIVITFVGDCTLGSEEHERSKPTSFDSYVLNYGFDYPFSGAEKQGIEHVLRHGSVG